jgi:His-Xaa-Ser repeat protein HxsA
MNRKFLIPSLIAAGIAPLADAKATVFGVGITTDNIRSKSIFRKFALDHRYTLAAHRSHSSHASHASHRSSTGGTYLPTPQPLYTPPAYVPPPVYVQPPVQPAPLVTLPGNSNKFKEIVKQVQLALVSFGYYQGTVDGVVSKAMRASLSRMQFDYDLKVTGTITPQVLDTLHITAQ